MYPCPECKRHLRATEVNCPFCGADLASKQAPAFAWTVHAALGALMFLGSTGCSTKDPTAESGGTTTSQDSTTEASTTIDDTSESGMVDTETDTDDGPDDTNSEGGSFYAGPGVDWGGISGCDPFLQDCPDGEKCVPYASAGGNWDANKCVPITGDGQPGEACTYGGLVEATDDCDGTGICWDVELIDGNMIGTCTAFCEGTADEPECDVGEACLIANDGSINVCVASCDPILQDCPEGSACQWSGSDFTCLPGADEPSDQPCDFGECPAGWTCVNGELAPNCGGAPCCAAFCSLSEPTCADPNTECVPLFEDPPPEYEDVGICIAS
jgi:hypothetical protein